jgi:hypothetical protein
MKAEVYAGVTYHGKGYRSLTSQSVNLVPRRHAQPRPDPRGRPHSRGYRVLNGSLVINLPELGDRKSVTQCGTLMVGSETSFIQRRAAIERGASWRSL